MRACRAPFSAVDPERLAPRTSLLIKRENNLLEIVEGRDGTLLHLHRRLGTPLVPRFRAGLGTRGE